ncbi:MAG: hypothetical protein JSU70_14015 [Phycisphaerales bacterium]|nr:MAG: hypothetical protein JSU70_14015 [Phycisphaerales bacterium]
MRALAISAPRGDEAVPRQGKDNGVEAGWTRCTGRGCGGRFRDSGQGDGQRTGLHGIRGAAEACGAAVGAGLASVAGPWADVPGVDGAQGVSVWVGSAGP